jgi:hypothetical protein
MPLLDPNRTYTFREIGKLKVPTDELLVEYDYSLERTLIDLPQYQNQYWWSNNPIELELFQRVQFGSLGFCIVNTN